MLPLSPAAFGFSACAVLLYWLCYRWKTWRLVVLLLVNFYFLARFAWFYPAILLAAASIDFLVGLGLQGTPRAPDGGQTRRRKLLVSISLLVNLGLLTTTKCLPLALGGGIAISIITHASAWGWLVADTVFFAFTALAEEVAFRGYGFQRFAVAVGPIGASIGFAAYYAIIQSLVPGSSRASLFVAMALGLVLSAAYLRTRALWVGWGINFGWKASRALLFGLAVAGVNSHSPVIQGDPMGPFWLTGGGFGLEGSWITFFLILLALPVVFRITRDLDFRYNAPVLVPAGIPVDLDAAARAQHETAMGAAEPAPPALIQIGPASTPPPAQPPQS